MIAQSSGRDRDEGQSMTRGGKRPGAGRPPARGETTENRSISLTPTVWEFLGEQDASAAKTIEDTIRKTKRFRDWETQRG